MWTFLQISEYFQRSRTDFKFWTKMENMNIFTCGTKKLKQNIYTTNKICIVWVFGKRTKFENLNIFRFLWIFLKFWTSWKLVFKIFEQILMFWFFYSKDLFFKTRTILKSEQLFKYSSLLESLISEHYLVNGNNFWKNISLFSNCSSYIHTYWSLSIWCLVSRSISSWGHGRSLVASSHVKLITV